MTSSAMPKTDPPSEKTVMSAGIISFSRCGREASAAVIFRIPSSTMPVVWMTLNEPPMSRRNAMISDPSRKPRIGASISHCGPRIDLVHALVRAGNRDRPPRLLDRPVRARRHDPRENEDEDDEAPHDHERVGHPEASFGRRRPRSVIVLSSAARTSAKRMMRRSSERRSSHSSRVCIPSPTGPRPSTTGTCAGLGEEIRERDAAAVLLDVETEPPRRREGDDAAHEAGTGAVRVHGRDARRRP